ncbi:MAG: tRNA lysidine(34) synthetase TilS [Clostridiales bacterium]|nr:tRNA lysidine(34) synthetase TilS [Candidatus Apopatousia equi]
MKKILETIKEQNLIKPNEKIGVAVSGGIDSMCLVHYLNSIKKDLNFTLTIINIDHQIRKTSKDDTNFVVGYAKENNIPCHTFKVNAVELSESKKMTLEEAARICRYKVFDSLLQKNIVDKIAIAHHKEDNVETILLNILRGTGLKGASGMEYFHDGYIRPMLNVSKSEILAYAQENGINHVEDETNLDTDYSRNFLRHEIVPILKKHWPNFDSNLLSFSKICKEDDDYINSVINFDNIIFEKDSVKIPVNMFIYPSSVVNRLIRKALEHLKALKDIERKHLNIIKTMALESENGTRINLPHNLVVHKEYDYITLTVKKEREKPKTKSFKVGKTKFDNGVEIVIKKTTKFDNVKLERTHIFDFDKLPKDAVWRTKENGDVFNKFGSGTKKLKDYFIDKKIPSRLRSEVPLLVSGNEVLIVLGVEISEKIKIDENTKTACTIKF